LHIECNSITFNFLKSQQLLAFFIFVEKKQQSVFFLKKNVYKSKNMYNMQYQLIIIDKSLGLFFLI